MIKIKVRGIALNGQFAEFDMTVPQIPAPGDLIRTAQPQHRYWLVKDRCYTENDIILNVEERK